MEEMIIIIVKKIYLSPSDQVKNLYAGGKTNEAVQCRAIALALADALERWFTQPEQVKEMQHRGIETANRLTEEKVAAMILTDCGF